MPCKNCPSSSSKTASKPKQSTVIRNPYVYHVIAFNKCDYTITINGKTKTFNQTATASASSTSHSLAAETAAKGARQLTSKIFLEHIRRIKIPYNSNGPKTINVRATTGAIANVHNYSDKTTYSVTSNDPNATLDTPLAACSSCFGCGCSCNQDGCCVPNGQTCPAPPAPNCSTCNCDDWSAPCVTSCCKQ